MSKEVSIKKPVPDKPEKARKFAEKKTTTSGQVPEGDVRLTANIREDIHIKLKVAAAQRRQTIGEVLEELIEKNL
jgi:hypothetical protein